MHVQISSLDICAALQGTSDLKLIHDFAQAHVHSANCPELLLATWANPWVTRQHLKAIKTYYSTTLLAVQRLLRQLVAAHTLQHLVRRPLHIFHRLTVPDLPEPQLSLRQLIHLTIEMNLLLIFFLSLVLQLVRLPKYLLDIFELKVYDHRVISVLDGDGPQAAGG